MEEIEDNKKCLGGFSVFLNLAVAVGLHLRPPVEQNFVEVTLLLGLDQRGAVLVGNLDLVILKLLELPDVVELHVTDLPDLFGRKHVLLVLLTLAVRPEKDRHLFYGVG